MRKDVKKSLLFIALTFLFNFSFIFAYFALGGKWVMPYAAIVGAIYMFVPMTVVIIVQKCIYKEPLKEPLGISWKINRWWLVAWFLPPALALATLAVSLLLPGVGYSPDMSGIAERFRYMLPPEQFEKVQKQMADFPIHPFWLGLVQGLIAGISVNALAGFGEELGWRGLLQKELGFLGFWRSSILIGAIWGIWHAPLILKGHNYPQHPVAGVFLMTGWCMLLAPIFSYIRLKAKSVIAAAIIHGSLNATYGLAIVFVRGSDLLVGLTGLAGFIVLAVVNIAIFIYERLVLCCRSNDNRHSRESGNPGCQRNLDSASSAE